MRRKDLENMNESLFKSLSKITDLRMKKLQEYVRAKCVDTAGVYGTKATGHGTGIPAKVDPLTESYKIMFL